MYPKKITITNNDLLITVKDSENNSIKINANELLKSKDVYELVEFMKFKYSYFYIVDKQKQEQRVACDILFNSNIAFKNRVPVHYISNNFDLNLESSNKDIQKSINQYLYGEKIITYICNDRYDEIISVLYNFLCNGYYLLECRECSKLFLRTNKNKKYCDSCKQIKDLNIKEKKKANQKEIAKREDYKIANRTRQRLYRELEKTNQLSDSKKFKYIMDLLETFNKNVENERERFNNNEISIDDCILYVTNYELYVKEKLKEVQNER